ncbi:MAG TPA: response regulator transcription factor [Solirubrobacteraceae bacterium]|nr:response regulator transcription factor [Solirubrobacteraceae bacterium]
MSSGDDPAAGSVRIVVADDHLVVRRGLRLILSAEPGLEVIAEAEDLDSARRYVRGHRPDVLVIDLNMPGEATLDALPGLRVEFPETQIVVLTAESVAASARRALAAGALGFVLKEAADSELIAAVRAAARGENYLNPRLGAALAVAAPAGPPGGLTQREADVLRLIALGYTNAQVGEQLYISVRTVETHRAHIQRKLAIEDRPALVQFALTHGLLDADPRA